MSDVPMVGDPVLAVAVRAARRAASVIVDAGRDLKRLPTFSKEHGEIAAAAGDEAKAACPIRPTAIPRHTSATDSPHPLDPRNGIETASGPIAVSRPRRISSILPTAWR